MSQRVTSGGIRITKVGFGFLIFGLILLVAATNTGNNGLYLVLAVMAGMFVVAQALCAYNVRGLELSLRPPGEMFANRPARFGITVRNRSRWLSRHLLLVVLERGEHRRTRRSRGRAAPLLIGTLQSRGQIDGDVEIMARQRGWWRKATLEVSSLFPVGFFHKIMRHPAPVDVLVFPEIFSGAASLPLRRGGAGGEVRSRRGWGHELAGLRPFRSGDDPRAIHWKQTARTGALVFKESASEENRRLAIIFDNAAGFLEVEAERVRFERLVSEGATAAVDALDRGWEVELVTRESTVTVGTGRQQRHRILEALALIEPVAESPVTLNPSTPGVRQLRLAMESTVAAPAPSSSGHSDGREPVAVGGSV